MAWWLVDSVMNGTLEEDYPIKLKDDCYPTVQSVDDVYQYHYPPINNEVQQSDNMSAHYFKYHEDEILQDIESYVSGTYRGHYTGTTHEYRNVQTLDLMASHQLDDQLLVHNHHQMDSLLIHFYPNHSRRSHVHNHPLLL